MTGKRKGGIIAALLVFMTLISGCGGSDENTVTIFMMDKAGSPSTIGETMEKGLKDKLGPDLKVEFNAMGIYNLQKLMVEYAAGANDIVILSKEDAVIYGKNGANLPLDAYFSPDDYPEGVFEGGISVEGEDDLRQEKHLYAIPASKLKMFKDTGYAPEELFVTVAVSTDNMDQSVKAIKAMME
ncbi:hypothetical protein [Paenibacillus wynnii]|uniref:hypothetical protein n=1 Tax=Paenibacillus wynnii TaxID=268407 RepID=UPI00068CE740|nr:hypothetical protein [Paenibacillus wynnii]